MTLSNTLNSNYPVDVFFVNRKPFGNTRSDHVASAALHNEFLFGQSSGGRPVRRSVLRHSNINILFDREVSGFRFLPNPTLCGSNLNEGGTVGGTRYGTEKHSN